MRESAAVLKIRENLEVVSLDRIAPAPPHGTAEIAHQGSATPTAIVEGVRTETDSPINPTINEKDSNINSTHENKSTKLVTPTSRNHSHDMTPIHATKLNKA